MLAAMIAGDWALADHIGAVLDRLDAALPSPSMVGAALWYAEHGLRVFPLQPASKLPMPGSRGCKDATCDREQIVRWWRATPRANLGLATGYGVDVLDYDGLKGHEAWGKEFHSPGHPWGLGMRVLATVSTPRPGGLHVYVPATGAGNRQAMLPGVDYRGLGGYVVAPPSTTPQGTYRFLHQLNPRGL